MTILYQQWKRRLGDDYLINPCRQFALGQETGQRVGISENPRAQKPNIPAGLN